MTCPYCERIRALLPSAKACPGCNHLMAGNTCDACFGMGVLDLVRVDHELRIKRVLGIGGLGIGGLSGEGNENAHRRDCDHVTS